MISRLTSREPPHWWKVQKYREYVHPAVLVIVSSYNQCEYYLPYYSILYDINLKYLIGCNQAQIVTPCTKVISSIHVVWRSKTGCSDNTDTGIDGLTGVYWVHYSICKGSEVARYLTSGLASHIHVALGRDILVAHGPEVRYRTPSALCASIGRWLLTDKSLPCFYKSSPLITAVSLSISTRSLQA